MNIEISKIPVEEKAILQNLVKMYCYEWSQYNKYDVNDQGEYTFESHISDYWCKERHYPFFIKVDGILAGFILIDNDFVLHPDYDYSMSEFFVMYKYRQSGVGRYAAKTVFDMFHGKWELGRHPHNIASVKFWDNVVNEYTKGRYELIRSCPKFLYHDGTYGDIISFEN